MVLMGRCRSEADDCEWITQRNVTASMRKSSRPLCEYGKACLYDVSGWRDIKSSSDGLLKGKGKIRREG